MVCKKEIKLSKPITYMINGKIVKLNQPEEKSNG